MSDTDLCRFGCGQRGTHYCPGQLHGVQPGLPMKYQEALKRIEELQDELKAEKSLRKTDEGILSRLEGMRASWQGRAEAAERELHQTEETLIRVCLERDGAEAKLEEIAVALGAEEMAEVA